MAEVVKKRKMKRSAGEEAVFVAMTVVLFVFALTIMYALFLLVITALKTPKEYALGNTWKLPESGYHFENFSSVFTVLRVNKAGYFDMILNTIWITLAPAILNISGTAMLSYAYAKYNFFGRRFIWSLNIACMTIALPGVVVSYYKLFADLGMRNSPTFLLSCWGGFGANFLIFVSFWNAISGAYAEAAMIDGAGHMTVFLKIMIPQAFPIIGIFFLLQFVAGWEGMGPCLYYLPNYPNIAYGLFVYKKKTERAMNYPVYCAALIMLAIPSIVLYSIFQEKIMRGMNIGGLKG